MDRWLWFLAGFVFALAIGALLLTGPMGLDPARVLGSAGLATDRVSAAPSLATPMLLPTPVTTMPASGQVPLRWTRQGGATSGVVQCNQLDVSEGTDVRFSLCEDGSRLAHMTVTELEIYQAYLDTYAPFDYTVQESEQNYASVTIRLQFGGRGTLPATMAEQARISAFARQLFDRLRGEELRGEILAKTRLDLAARRNYAIEAMQVLSVEEALWPDSCLGLRVQGKFCALVATPGYRVVLTVQGESFEYRASETGVVALATGHPPYMTIPALTP